MKIKIKDPVFAFDADGEPVAGRVAGIDGKRGVVTVAPIVCGPIDVSADRVMPATPPDTEPAAAAAPQQQQTPPPAGVPTAPQVPTPPE